MKSSIKQSTAKKMSACLQKLFVFIFAFGSFMNVHGQLYENNPLVAAHREINNSQAFQNVEVRGDVVVFLTNEKTSDIMLQGEKRDIDAVITTEKDAKLEINATKTRFASKLIIYLPAAKMHSLIVTGDTRVFSSGDVLVDDLEITLKGNSMVKVYHYGKLTVTPAQGYELAEVAATY